MVGDLWGKRFTKKVSFEFRVKEWRGDGWGEWRTEGWIEVSIKRWNWFTKWKWKLIPEMRLSDDSNQHKDYVLFYFSQHYLGIRYWFFETSLVANSYQILVIIKTMINCYLFQNLTRPKILWKSSTNAHRQTDKPTTWDKTSQRINSDDSS